MRRRRVRRPVALRALLRIPAARVTLQQLAPESPADVREWLASLTLLTGVPFERIVADIRMLPSESIRFFYVDQNWVGAAIDGALSVASTTQQNEATIELLASHSKAAVRASARTLRRRQVAARGIGPAEPVAGKGSASAVTGFLLRSIIVADLPGLNVGAFADAEGKQPLPILRLDLLAPTVMIALFDGQAARFDIAKPGQLLHFGVERTSAGYTVFLRGIGGTLEAGVSLPPNTQWPNPAQVPLRKDPAGRQVLDIDSLRQSLSSALDRAYQERNAARPAFHAAAFALQMIGVAEHQSFVRGAHESGRGIR